jgi:hypothetical protein
MLKIQIFFFIAAQGALYGPNKERGVFKSIDGGESLKQFLVVF